MRLHRLDVTAFGPFTDTVSVDFDELGRAGLFLLSGPTGAGKTSVLDAVCFGLYGDVPGDRSSAKRLRADQAAPGVAPRVVLEATLAGRRFRLTRAPAWSRPKRRGEGFTTQQASVTVSERTGEAADPTWVPLTSRLDEAGDLVGGLLGMNLTQFTQVAMLPQGRFAAFLRAKSDERHRLLQRLFRTGRFEDIERWLVERRRSLTRESARCHDQVADVVSRISETTAQALPEAWDLHDLSGPAGDDAMRPWVAQSCELAAEVLATARVGAAVAGTAEEQARIALEQARIEHRHRTRLREAHTELATLRARASEHDDDVRRLDAARRASTVLPLHRRVVAAAADRDRAAERASASLGLAAEALGEIPVDLAASVATATETAASTRAALPRAARWEHLQAESARLAWEASSVAEELASAGTRLDAAVASLPTLRAAEEAAREAALRHEGLVDQVGVLAERVQAAGQAAALRVSHAEAREAFLDARAHTLDLRDNLAALQEARVEGMAAELAQSLAVGCSCPVCGSAEHPRKAAASDGAPDAGAERAARARVDDAAAAQVAHDDVVRSLETRLAAVVARAGNDSVEQLERQWHAARTEAASVGAAARRHADLVREREAAEQEQDRLREHTVALHAREAGLVAELAAVQGQAESVRDEITDLLTGTGRRSLGDLVDHLDEVAARCDRAQDDARHAETAAVALAEAISRLDDACHEAGLDDVAALLAAALPPEVMTRLERQITTHERRLAAVTEVLGDLAGPDDPHGASGSDGPTQQDLDLLTAEHSTRRDEHAAAHADLEAATARATRVSALADLLSDALAQWQPVRAEWELTSGLASFVEGRSPDNSLRMRLSAYVLSYRLTQVVDAANERLVTMSEQRYALEHTGDRGVGETRGGLSLLVRDDWSGESRDPATLSGGETFVVSLALALGLADVIAHETGGAALDTLFVDEGFGSLDADTLDDVMDTLDALRDGGRVVGVVSHVAEMRDRIPTQLVVAKSRAGSTLAVRG